MCILDPRIRWERRWNWDGGRIVHDAIVSSSRPVVLRKRGNYDIDPREFLVSERNAVMRRTLKELVAPYVKDHPLGNLEHFYSREPGSFDHRADMITAYIRDNIDYQHKPGDSDPWQFPDETLSLGSGDCEDRALLIASLLLASGISSFNIRVALGRFITTDGKGARKSHGHVWVMYKNEVGRWLVLEPALTKEAHDGAGRSTEAAPVSAEYEPLYLFNDVHVWAMPDGRTEEGIDLKRDWSQVKPTFSGLVHKTVLHDALSGTALPAHVFDKRFTAFLGREAWTVDDVDRDPYDPLDHFDNGFIAPAWERVRQRLDVFRADRTQLDAFYRAAHAIADFYAHSSYAHFAAQANGTVPPFMAMTGDAMPAARYDQGAFALARFSRNDHIYQGDPEATAYWAAKVISGRYAQPKKFRNPFSFASEDISWRSRVRSYDAAIKDREAFAIRGSLPHHEEIAVDEGDRNKKHMLYGAEDYPARFQARRAAAVEHIHQVALSIVGPG